MAIIDMGSYRPNYKREWQALQNSVKNSREHAHAYESPTSKSEWATLVQSVKNRQPIHHAHGNAENREANAEFKHEEEAYALLIQKHRMCMLQYPNPTSAQKAHCEKCAKDGYHAKLYGRRIPSCTEFKGGLRKTHARRKGSRKTNVTRKQRGGRLFDSKLLAAAKAGRLTTEGKGNKDSVLELLDDAITHYGDVEYYTEKRIVTYKRKDEFHEADVTAYLRIIDGMSEGVKKNLSNWVKDKLGNGISEIHPETPAKKMILEILLHILKINMKASDNPLAGIGRAPEAHNRDAGVKVSNPLHALSRLRNPNNDDNADNAAPETPPSRRNLEERASFGTIRVRR